MHYENIDCTLKGWDGMGMYWSNLAGVWHQGLDFWEISQVET